MKIAIVQHDIPSNDYSENLKHLETLLDQQPGADMYVLAETFATGFMPEGSVGGAGQSGSLYVAVDGVPGHAASCCRCG